MFCIGCTGVSLNDPRDSYVTRQVTQPVTQWHPITCGTVPRGLSMHSIVLVLWCAVCGGVVTPEQCGDWCGVVYRRK